MNLSRLIRILLFLIMEIVHSNLEDLGFSEEEWYRAGKVTILRAAVLTPYMNEQENFEKYVPKIQAAMQDKLRNL